MMDLDSWCSSQFLDVENMKTSVMLSQLIEWVCMWRELRATDVGQP